MHFWHKFISIYLIQNKTFNYGILLKSVLFAKLLNKPFASCSLINIDFLIPQEEHFDCITNLLFFVLTFWVNIFSIFPTLYAINIHLIIIKLIVNFFVLKK